jgi:hypothetical protein
LLLLTGLDACGCDRDDRQHFDCSDKRIGRIYFGVSFKTCKNMAGIKGHGGRKGKSGRKSKAEEMGLAALLNKCWTQEDRENCILALAQTAANPASDDRMDAAKLLMSYAFGKPTEKVEHAGGEGLPIEVVIRHVSESKTSKDRD